MQFLELARPAVRKLRRVGLEAANRIPFIPQPPIVDFVIAGTQKGGTTALYKYLSQSPEILLPNKKELHYFNKDRLFKRRPNYWLYHEHFKEKKGSRIAGEATPAYMYWPPSAERIKRYNGRMKLVLLLRNPIDRAYSHWHMMRRRGLNSLSFEEAIAPEIDAFREGPEAHAPSLTVSILERGRYSHQIRRIYSHFPKEQVHIMLSEQLSENPRPLIRNVCKFLGIKEFNIAPLRAHEGKYASTIEPDCRAQLRDLFASDIHDLKELCAVDWPEWSN